MERIVKLILLAVAATTVDAASARTPRRACKKGTAAVYHVGTTWLNRAWGESNDPTINPDQGQQLVELNMYNVLTPEQVAGYKGAGKKVICYTSGGQIFDYEKKKYPDVPTLNKVDDGYGGNRWWVDILNYEAAGPWIEDKLNEANRLGCDAFEFDNVDCWEYDTCHPKYPAIQDPTLKDAQLKMLHILVDKLHAHGLKAGLKNAATLVVLDPTLSDKYDFSIVENCNNYCHPFQAFIDKDKAVLSTQNVDYAYKVEGTTGGEDLRTLACADAKSRHFYRMTDFDRTGWKVC